MVVNVEHGPQDASLGGQACPRQPLAGDVAPPPQGRQPPHCGRETATASAPASGVPQRSRLPRPASTHPPTDRPTDRPTDPPQTPPSRTAPASRPPSGPRPSPAQPSPAQLSSTRPGPRAGDLQGVWPPVPPSRCSRARARPAGSTPPPAPPSSPGWGGAAQGKEGGRTRAGPCWRGWAGRTKSPRGGWGRCSPGQALQPGGPVEGARPGLRCWVPGAWRAFAPSPHATARVLLGAWHRGGEAPGPPQPPVAAGSCGPPAAGGSGKAPLGVPAKHRGTADAWGRVKAAGQPRKHGTALSPRAVLPVSTHHVARRCRGTLAWTPLQGPGPAWRAAFPKCQKWEGKEIGAVFTLFKPRASSASAPGVRAVQSQRGSS